MVAQVTEGAGSGTPQLANGRFTSPEGHQLADDFDAFLRLMTAQMRNQDPLEPLDGTDFVAQLAQFSSVEQQIKANEKLDGLLAALTRSDAEVAVGFLGRTVESASGRVEVTPGEPVQFAFETNGAEARLVAVVTDENGDTIDSFSLSADGPGRHQAAWHGRDAGGEQPPPGSYTIRIDVYDDAGEKVIGEITPLTRAKVVEARLEGDGGASLILSNGAKVGPSDLTAISL